MALSDDCRRQVLRQLRASTLVLQLREKRHGFFLDNGKAGPAKCAASIPFGPSGTRALVFEMLRLTPAELAELAELNPEILDLLEKGTDPGPVPLDPPELCEWFRSTDMFRREAATWMAREYQRRHESSGAGAMDLADAFRAIWPEAIPSEWRGPPK